LFLFPYQHIANLPDNQERWYAETSLPALVWKGCTKPIEATGRNPKNRLQANAGPTTILIQKRIMDATLSNLFKEFSLNLPKML
jgi:hypothetical protein